MLTKLTSNPILKEILEWTEAVLIALVLVILIRGFIFENTKVLGHSMEPTLHHNNAIIVNKFIYKFTKPKQGDIIVFPYKQDPTKDYIKRVLGLPGDTVNIKNHIVYINDLPLDESYKLETMAELGDITFPFVVPQGTYFVMGDNRNNSSDSRYRDVGTIKKSDIIGKAVLRVWPLNQLGLIK